MEQKEKEQQLLHIALHNIPEPTRKFEIGEDVDLGAFDHCIVEEILYEGKVYVLKCTQDCREDTNLKFEDRVIKTAYRVVSFIDITKKVDNSKLPIHTVKNDLWLNYSQQSIFSILNKLFYFGVDMEPEYQRELVWELKDKVSLIDSIFNRIDIGKFVFVNLPWKSKESPSYEILDGKQRINAIKDFYLDKFRYKGQLFSDLHTRDKDHFTNYPVSIAEIDKPDDINLLYKYFIKVNTTGKVMDKEHIEKIKSMIKE